MKPEKFIYFVISSYLLLKTFVAERTDSPYIFVSPRSLKVGMKNEVQLLRFGCALGGSLDVTLYYNSNGNETFVSKTSFKLEEGKSSSKFHLLSLLIPQFGTGSHYNGRLQFNGTICDHNIGGSAKIEYSTPKTSLVIIQTDEPIYKPGQTVRFRVLKLDKKLIPSQDEKDIADVYVEDESRSRMFQFDKVPIGAGLIQKEFTLSDKAVKGTWKITVTNGIYTEYTTFSVQDYVPPDLKVRIRFPSFVLANSDTIPVKICASFLNGKPLLGSLFVKASMESYPSSNEKLPVLEEERIDINGCYDYSLNPVKIETGPTDRHRRIRVEAKVLDYFTEARSIDIQYLSRQFSPLKLNFHTDTNQRNNFKPGLPFKGQLHVNNPDDTPAAQEPIQICALVQIERTIRGCRTSKELKFCRNYTSNAAGIVKYTLLPKNVDWVSIQLEAKSLRYEKDQVMSEPRATLHLTPYYSPSKSFLHILRPEQLAPCGKPQNVTVLFTSEGDGNELNIFYEVIKQGKVAKIGQRYFTFHSDNDVSSKYQKDEQLINESGTEVYPTPSAQSLSNIKSCPQVRESKYSPYIGEVELPISGDDHPLTSFTLLVFYFRDDNEVVSDSQTFTMEKCLQNKVHFKFGDEMKSKGTKTTVEVSTAPKSLCGLKIVDKSISLLDSSDQLTADKVFQMLENMDTNDYYGTNPCNKNPAETGSNSSGPHYSSFYVDAFASFQEAGYIPISNLELFTRPCEADTGPVALAREKSFGPGGSEANEVATSKRSIGDISNYFPETWLFKLETIGDDGKYISKETLPETVTDWMGSAVCISPKLGLGISETSSIRGVPVFFLTFTLPVSVFRGEVFIVEVLLFNYGDKAVAVTVTLETDGFETVGRSIDGDICIQPSTTFNLKLKLKATGNAKVGITVTAKSSPSKIACGSSAVYDEIEEYYIRKSMYVGTILH